MELLDMIARQRERTFGVGRCSDEQDEEAERTIARCAILAFAKVLADKTHFDKEDAEELLRQERLDLRAAIAGRHPWPR